MAIIKCKMCGGELIITEGSTVAECEYCGTRQTIPSMDNEKKLTLFARANRLRAACEFDKAAGVYETIVADFPEEAEAYWGLVLCRYGIEYVDDPATGKKIPTCHRSSFDSVMDDKDFELVMENSDAISRKVYREEAKQIEELRKSIIEVSGKEEPYDIFICYKETSEDGQRTIDSVLAQDIYDKLTDAGYRVFFSRITLEDKLGQEYEPYIFAALNSAKIMLVFGTDYEYFNAVWVKNEWSRFLKLMEKDKEKRLIPCYKGIDAYDMPKEFAKLQAQDMGKVGADQDLIRAIKKLLPKGNLQTDSVQPLNANNVSVETFEPLLKRAFMYLEDEEWKNADEYAEKVLDQAPDNAEAYLIKIMVEEKVAKREALANCAQPFDRSNNYKKVMRFGDEKLKEELNGYLSIINERLLKAISEEKQEAERVAAALKKGKHSDTPSLNEQLLRLKKRIDFLSALEDDFDNEAAFLENINEKITAVESQGKSLSEQRSKLGLFAGKEKKRIDAELANISETKAELLVNKDRVESKLDGYTEKSEVIKDLAEAKERFDEIEEQMEKERIEGSQSYGFDEAWNLYINDKKLARKVDSIYPAAAFSIALIGRTRSVFFGNYIQKRNGASEPIEWEVLVRKNGRMLLISKYALDCKEYHTGLIVDSWESCALRKWLNGEFIKTAFSSEEQRLITEFNGDKVLLLSFEEVNSFFSDDKPKLCRGTDYCYSKGAFRDPNGNCWWWLRSAGFNALSSTSCSRVSIRPDGNMVNCSNVAVRPAIWINLGEK